MLVPFSNPTFVRRLLETGYECRIRDTRPAFSTSGQLGLSQPFLPLVAEWLPVLVRARGCSRLQANKQNKQLAGTLPTSGVAHAQGLLTATIDDRSTL